MPASAPSDRQAQVDQILDARREAVRRRQAETEAQQRRQRQRVERTATEFRRTLRPVLDEFAAILCERGLIADVGGSPGIGDPPRLVLHVAEPSGNGHGPPRVVEGSLTFSAGADLECVSAREETWRLLRGGARENAGVTTLAQLPPAWVEARVVDFLRHLLLIEPDGITG